MAAVSEQRFFDALATNAGAFADGGVLAMPGVMPPRTRAPPLTRPRPLPLAPSRRAAATAGRSRP
jgi:hypothetical protein